MFGYARVRRHEITRSEYDHLRSHYCGLCHALRQDFNLPAAFLTGWDGRFLALLVNAQLVHPPERGQTRCPAVFGLHYRPIINMDVATRYAAAVSVFLLGEKLEDTIIDGSAEDSKVWLASGLKRVVQKQVDQAASILVELGFPLRAALQLRQEQKKLEACNRGYDLNTITEPTAKAIALIFAHTAKLAQMPENEKPLTSIGSCVGRLIALLDACEDYIEDVKRNQFNAVVATLSNDKPIQPLPEQHYRQVMDYLLVQLNEIRTKATMIRFNRYAHLVQNTLFMGLYDATMQACQQLAANVSDINNDAAQYSCSTCGRTLSSHFCPHCGTSRYFASETS